MVFQAVTVLLQDNAFRSPTPGCHFAKRSRDSRACLQSCPGTMFWRHPGWEFVRTGFGDSFLVPCGFGALHRQQLLQFDLGPGLKVKSTAEQEFIQRQQSCSSWCRYYAVRPLRGFTNAEMLVVSALRRLIGHGSTWGPRDRTSRWVGLAQVWLHNVEGALLMPGSCET